MLASSLCSRWRPTAALRVSSVAASWLRPLSCSILSARRQLGPAFCIVVRALKTFIPFAGSTPEEGVLRSLLALDDKRLGKQRVETYQIWKMVRGLPFDNTKRPPDHQSLKPAAWSKHPAVNMWMGYPDALALYLLANVELWAQRCSPSTGLPYNNGLMLDNIARWRIRFKADQPDTLVAFANTAFPPWWGDARVHDSDKAILFRKDHTAYAHLHRYALQYEQYVWPYQLDEEASRRRRQAASAEHEGRDSDGDEEPEGLVADGAFGEQKHGDETRDGQQRPKRKRAARKQRRRAKQAEEAVELDEDDEQVDAAVVTAMHADSQRIADDRAEDAEGDGDGAGHGERGRRRGKRPARDGQHAKTKKKRTKAAIDSTEGEDAEAAPAAEDTALVQSEPRARGRRGQSAKRQLAMGGSDRGSHVRGEGERHQQQRKVGNRNKHNEEEVADDDAVERRRSGKRTSVAA